MNLYLIQLTTEEKQLLIVRAINETFINNALNGNNNFNIISIIGYSDSTDPINDLYKTDKQRLTKVIGWCW
jgi:hypothetical protein